MIDYKCTHGMLCMPYSCNTFFPISSWHFPSSVSLTPSHLPRWIPIVPRHSNISPSSNSLPV